MLKFLPVEPEPSGAREAPNSVDGDTPGAFAREAKTATRNGLVVIPCGGSDGKKPLLPWRHITREDQTEKQLAALRTRNWFRTANLGILTGPSGLTIIDCDTPGKLDEVLAWFGPTPIVVSTPRRGFHLYYKSGGQKCTSIKTADMAIDVKGVGGFVVAPPSSRRLEDGRRANYQFLEGDWESLASLPYIRAGSVAALPGKNAPTPHSTSGERVQVGRRNKTLFDALRRIADHVSSHAQLAAEAEKINREFEPPLPHQEMVRTAASVWKYKEEDRLFCSSKPKICLPHSVMQNLLAAENGAEAFALLGLLLANHGARARRGEEFAIVAEAMAAAELIRGWGIKRYRAAAQILLCAGYIEMTHKGGRTRGDPSRFRLAAELLT